MTRLTDHQRVIRAIKGVPAKNLRLLELVWDVLDENGEIDYKKVADRTPDVNLALAEAERYGTATREAVAALTRLEGRPETKQRR